MNTRILFPLLFTVASFSASAGNWAVKNGWCQTMTEDGQALVMLKNGTIGITGLMQGCPNGVQTLLGSRISINGNLIPTSQMCNPNLIHQPLKALKIRQKRQFTPNTERFYQSLPPLMVSEEQKDLKITGLMARARQKSVGEPREILPDAIDTSLSILDHRGRGDTARIDTRISLVYPTQREIRVKHETK